MINEKEVRILGSALERLSAGFDSLPAFTPEFDEEAVAAVIDRVAERMQDNYPYWHPQYAGQMLKPPHAVARIAYALSLWINPNNHALDGGRASSAMEKECIVDLGRMYGWQAPLGHLTGGGTMANLEALWVAGRLEPGKRILASDQAHYTHGRISEVLGLPFTAVRTDCDGRMDVAHLQELVAAGDVAAIVATMGNTGLGAVDPLADILDVAGRHEVRVHADAAYGGYFGLASLLDERARAAFDALPQVDSIVVDPHKHGLQPYGCGCVLFRDPDVGRFYQHGSPYTYFSSAELHLGEISLECSRAGAAAVALWATMQLYPPAPDGEFAAQLDGCLRAARALYRRLDESPRFAPLMAPELDIVVYAAESADARRASDNARKVFAAAAEKELHLALIELPVSLVTEWIPDLEANAETVTCLRSVMMKADQETWIDEIVTILESVA